MIANTQNVNDLIGYIQQKHINSQESSIISQFLKESLAVQSFENIHKLLKAYALSGNDPNFIDFESVKNYIEIKYYCYQDMIFLHSLALLKHQSKETSNYDQMLSNALSTHARLANLSHSILFI